MSDHRTAASVGAILRRAGIATGYRYTTSGYCRSDNMPATEPGCEVTRSRRSRYGGKEDAGGVLVYPIDPRRQDSSPDAEFVARVVSALTDAGLPLEAVGSLSIKVADR